MGSDSACLSDAARSWLEMEKHIVSLSSEDTSRSSVTPSADVALLLTLCTIILAMAFKTLSTWHFCLTLDQAW
jgi:hypothetical protein